MEETKRHVVFIECFGPADDIVVSMKFNQEAVDLIRGLDRQRRRYDPDAKVWLVAPYCRVSLARALRCRGFDVIERDAGERSA